MSIAVIFGAIMEQSFACSKCLHEPLPQPVSTSSRCLEQSEEQGWGSQLHFGIGLVHIVPTFYQSPPVNLELLLQTCRLQSLCEVQVPLCTGQEHTHTIYFLADSICNDGMMMRIHHNMYQGSHEPQILPDPQEGICTSQ